MDASNSKGWEATLTPHRSLTRQGFLLVMMLVAAVNLVVGGLFMAIGAWPVAWVSSWVIAFPTVLVVLPIVRRLVARIVAPP